MTTKERILQIAEDLVQQHGFNAFSYKDISAKLGIKTSSIHYYFPTKDDLAIELINVYKKASQQCFERFETQGLSGKAALLAYGGIFINIMKEQNKFCLCGFMAAEQTSLSDKVKDALQDYFQFHLKWLETTIKKGVESYEFQNCIKPKAAAALFLSCLEGGMLLSRIKDIPLDLELIIKDYLKLIDND